MPVREFIESKGVVVHPPLRPVHPDILRCESLQLLFHTDRFPRYVHYSKMQVFADRRGTIFAVYENHVAMYIFKED